MRAAIERFGRRVAPIVRTDPRCLDVIPREWVTPALRAAQGRPELPERVAEVDDLVTGFLHFGLRLQCIRDARPGADFRSIVARAAMRRDPARAYALLPRALRSAAHTRAFTKHVPTLELVPPSHRTSEMTLAAVLVGGETRHAPLLAPLIADIVAECARGHSIPGEDVAIMSKTMRDPASFARLLTLAVMANGESRTRDALLANPVMFRALRPEQLPPALLRDAAFLSAMVSECAAHFTLLPEHARSAPVCRAAVRALPGMLRHVPMDLRDHELCLEAVRRRGADLQHVPVNLRSVEVCHAALRENPLALRFVPPCSVGLARFEA